MKSLTGSVVGLRSGDINLGDLFQLYAAHVTCKVLDEEADIPKHTTLQLFMGLGGQVVILEFPVYIYPSSNLASVCAVLTGETITIGEVNKLVHPTVSRIMGPASDAITSSDPWHRCVVIGD